MFSQVRLTTSKGSTAISGKPVNLSAPSGNKSDISNRRGDVLAAAVAIGVCELNACAIEDAWSSEICYQIIKEKGRLEQTCR